MSNFGLIEKGGGGEMEIRMDRLCTWRCLYDQPLLHNFCAAFYIFVPWPFHHLLKCNSTSSAASFPRLSNVSSLNIPYLHLCIQDLQTWQWC